jgi:outer membrane receptor for ferrienterochelin and colicin
MRLYLIAILITVSILHASAQVQPSKPERNFKGEPKTGAAASSKPNADETAVVWGKVIDEKTGETLTGVAVTVQTSTNRVLTDVEGKYTLNLPAGTYQLTFKNLAYQQATQQVLVKAGEQLNLNITLEPESRDLGSTVVKAKMKKESLNTLLVQQKNAPAVSDGISIETIRKTPDRSTAEIMKRVSGASIQDGKFIIIRGLNDRYNSAWINGAPLPGSEPDRKSFSFDIFPANLIDQIIVSKTATPDKTGDFAGGIIEIITRDIPEKNFASLSLGTNYNSIATFKPYQTYQRSGTDFLGFDNGSRSLPNSLPSSTDFQKLNATQQTAYSSQLANNWNIYNKSSALPALNMQWVMGRKYKLFKKEAGSIISISYSRQQRFNKAIRQDYTFAGEENFKYTDSLYKNNVLGGIIWNNSLKINNRNRLSFKNTFSVNTEDQTVTRTGTDFNAGSLVKAYSYLYTQNLFSSSQLAGDHAFLASRIKMKWNVGLSLVNRNIPDYRRMRYMKPTDANQDPDQPQDWQAFIGTSASPMDGGRFYSSLNEQVLSSSYDITKTFVPEKKKKVLLSDKIDLKGGVYGQYRARTFDARLMGYIQNPGFNTGLLSLPIDQIFSPDNMKPGGFRISENTNPNDKYTAVSKLVAGYVMLDQKVNPRLRLIYGLRTEYFNQIIHSHDYTNKPIEVNTKKLDFLPSINTMYALTDKSNLRAAVSRTVSRPEFRELAPFSFFDFNQFTSLQGSEKLIRTSIINYDIRYELYPGAGELISVSLFHKNFTNPVELTLDPAIGVGLRSMTYRNVDKATASGFELEFRKKIILTRRRGELVASGNFSYISSKVDMRNVVGSARDFRPLQGQSPYIINGGLNYTHRKGFSANLVVNRVGPRISTVGTKNYLEFYEKPRTIIDFQLAKSFLKEKLESKLSIGDILAQNLVNYQPIQPKTGETINTKNNLPINTIYNGRTVSASLAWKF